MPEKQDRDRSPLPEGGSLIHAIFSSDSFYKVCNLFIQFFSDTDLGLTSLQVSKFASTCTRLHTQEA